MNKTLAALCVAISILAFAVAGADAAPTQVNVRIEGRSETLFEGPIATEPHGVRASSDKSSKLRRCDGINVNDPQNVVPAVTPIAGAADAMALVGQTFDGQWYSSYEDYFVTRFGPDAQNPSAPGGGAYWGILVNDTFTAVGGCQYQLDGGDELLWIYDAFQNRPTLALFPQAAGYSSGPRPLTVTGVAPGQAVPVEVVSYADDLENDPPAAPTRLGSSPFEGAKVSPVITAANGFERVETATGPTSDSQGKATVSYTEPGWHRIKATVGSPGAESVIRSNRLDICVSGGGGATLEGATSCNELPAADRVRVPPATSGEVEGPAPGGTAGSPAPSGAGISGSAATASSGTGSLKVSVPRIDRKQLAQGRLGVSWTVQDPGPGVKRWTISSQTVGRKATGYVVRASGAKTTAATVQLPQGAAYRLRFAITDALGRTSTVSLGKVRVPEAGPRRHR
jgi:hypothetical protein